MWNDVSIRIFTIICTCSKLKNIWTFLETFYVQKWRIGKNWASIENSIENQRQFFKRINKENKNFETIKNINMINWYKS